MKRMFTQKQIENIAEGIVNALGITLDDDTLKIFKNVDMSDYAGYLIVNTFEEILNSNEESLYDVFVTQDSITYELNDSEFASTFNDFYDSDTGKYFIPHSNTAFANFLNNLVQHVNLKIIGDTTTYVLPITYRKADSIYFINAYNSTGDFGFTVADSDASTYVVELVEIY